MTCKSAHVVSILNMLLSILMAMYLCAGSAKGHANSRSRCRRNTSEKCTSWVTMLSRFRLPQKWRWLRRYYYILSTPDPLPQTTHFFSKLICVRPLGWYLLGHIYPPTLSSQILAETSWKVGVGANPSTLLHQSSTKRTDPSIVHRISRKHIPQ